MRKVIIFGAGGSGEKVYEQLREEKDTEIVAFLDNFKAGVLHDLPIYLPEHIKELQYDIVIIANCAVKEVTEQLIELGVSKTKIQESFTGVWIRARDLFVRNFAVECYRKNMVGNVAEAGVYRGEFAAVINECFPDKTLYLFDTFEGFDERDTIAEEGWEDNPERGNFLKGTSIELVEKRMPHLEKVIIKKGYVPETFEGIDDQFLFVNLDMDLYQPTKEALKWFWPRMVKGG